MPVFAFSQGIRINGTVFDNEGPLAGVAIVIKGTTQGVASNDNGEFSITISGEADTLEFVYAGYKTEAVRVGQRKILAVLMTEETTELDEVTVVAFGVQKKESVIASITTVNPSDLKVPSSNLTTALAGRMAGMIAYQRSGEPGRDNAEFFIRGVTTFGYKKDPLILIDNNESTTEELSRMQPDDIASFSIMKDATATALYGSRGANGVILVTTKEGTEGKARVNIRYEEAISRPTDMVKLADPVTYMRLHNEAVQTRNPLGLLPYSQNKIDNTVAGGNPYVYPANDWYDILFKDYTQNHRLNFSVGGGGQIARYYLAGSVINDSGLLKVEGQNNFNNNVSLNRYMLRSNVNINITKTTEAIVRLHGAFDDYVGPMYGGQDMFNRVMMSNPVLFPPYFAPDEAHIYEKHVLYGNSGSDYRYVNPYADMTRGYMNSTTSQLSAQFELKQKLDFITEGLELRGLFNTSRYSYFDVSRYYFPFFYEVYNYNKRTDTYRLLALNEEGTGAGTDYLDYSEGDKTITATTYFEAALNWMRTFNEKHTLSGLLVYTMREQLNSNAGNLQKSLPYRNISLAGRATYAYDSRYFLEFNFGYNGSERFSQKERFGFFPSAGLGWYVSNEKFWSEELAKTVSKLKLKATYGIVGNDAIGDENDRFFYLSRVTMDDGNMSSSFGTYGNQGGRTLAGVSISRYPNDEITWETAAKLNLGIELGLFNKLELQADLFSEYRKNILMDRASIPTTMGLQETPRANVGEAASKGFDISLEYNHSINKDFWISGMANFTFAISEFKVYEEPDYSDTPWKSHVGRSLNQEWGYVAERLFVDEDEVRNSPEQFGEYLAGDIKYKDVNRDGKITELDQVPIGYPKSPEIVYGFGLSTGWKNIDFSFFFQGLARESFWISLNHEYEWDGDRRGYKLKSIGTTPFIDGASALLDVYANDHWSESNRSIYALWPRLSDSYVDNNRQSSTWWMRDGSFLRLKSVEIGYSLPQKIAERIYMRGLRVYVSGTNLLTFSKFKLWDPEMGGNGLGYPIQQVFNFGVQLSF
ncbi:MAG: TonB-dependent receptor [Tannerella sp.]|jgi:TonB-linked SusC/RagA family outer membrane protein|nr:TonB-dependent receptor [Tannerella sp.]